jgi:hypothetical protein
LFAEDKLNDVQSNPSCLKARYVYGVVNITSDSKKWNIEIGLLNLSGKAEFNIAIRDSTTGEISPALMVVKV